MLRLHYVTLPLLQGRGPKGGPRARARHADRGARAGFVLGDPADSQRKAEPLVESECASSDLGTSLRSFRGKIFVFQVSQMG